MPSPSVFRRRTIPRAAAAAFLAAALLAGCQQPTKRADNLVRLGNRHYHNFEYESALAAYRRAESGSDKAKSDGVLLYRMARCAALQGHDKLVRMYRQRAIQRLGARIEAGRETPLTYFCLGDLHSKPAERAAIFRAGIIQFRNRRFKEPVQNWAMGKLYAETGDSWTARSWFARAHRAMPGVLSFAYSYAVALSETLMHREAVEIWKKVVALRPLVTAYAMMADDYRLLGLPDEAAKCLRQARRFGDVNQHWARRQAALIAQARARQKKIAALTRRVDIGAGERVRIWPVVLPEDDLRSSLAPSFSIHAPTGHILLAARDGKSGEHRVYALTLNGVARRWLMSDPRHPMLHPQLSAAGDRVFVENAGAIGAYDLRVSRFVPLKEPTRRRDGRTEIYAHPVLSPDGRRLAYVAKTDNLRTVRIVVMDLPTGKEQVVEELARTPGGSPSVSDLAFTPDGSALFYATSRVKLAPGKGGVAFADPRARRFEIDSGKSAPVAGVAWSARDKTTRPPRQFAPSPDGRWLMLDARVLRWLRAPGGPDDVRPRLPHPYLADAVAFTADGRYLVLVKTDIRTERVSAWVMELPRRLARYFEIRSVEEQTGFDPYIVREPARTLRLAKALLEKYRGDAHLHFILGRCHDVLKFHKQAEWHLTRAVDLAPEQPAYYYWLARCLRGKGRLVEKVVLLRKAIERAPDDSRYAAALAELYAATPNHMAQALAAYDQAARIERRSPGRNPWTLARYHVERVRLYCRLNRPDDAVKFLLSVKSELDLRHLNVLATDPAFKVLWRDRRFLALVGRPIPEKP